MTYDISIAYRIYPGNPMIPALVYPTNKFKLARLCLFSLLRALGTLRARFYFILDTCPDYEAFLHELITSTDMHIEHHISASNPKTFELQLGWLSNQNHSEIVFFAEDDYLYRPNSLQKAVKLLHSESRSNSFLTPYDHPDYYSLSWHTKLFKSRVASFGNSTLVTRASTTCTFMCSKTTLKNSYAILTGYSRIGDIGFWFLLTSKNTLTLIRTMLYYSIHERNYILRFFMKAFFYKLFHDPAKSASFELISFVPSIATHVESKFLAPHVDWYLLAETYEHELTNYTLVK